ISPATADVTPGYFEAMGATLVRGRFFDSRDSAAGPKAIIVDETLARRFWPNQDPIGRRMYRPTDLNNLVAITDKTVFFTVVGVIKDMKLRDLTEGKKVVGAYFYPMDQDSSAALSFALRTDGDPFQLVGPVRHALAELDRELPVFDVRTMDQMMEKSLMTR